MGISDPDSTCGCSYCDNGRNCTAQGTCSCGDDYTGPSCETPITELPVCGFNDSLRCHYGSPCEYTNNNNENNYY